MTTVSQATTPPTTGLNHIDALLDGGPGWNWLAPARNVLYYTFSTTPANTGAGGQISGAATAFNAAQQAAAVTALNYLSQITGIRFTPTTDGGQADLHFATVDLVGDNVSGLCSWSYSYGSLNGNVTSYSADAWVYLDNVQWAGDNSNPAPGGDGYETLLHELAHALGLKHPFEGPVQLPAVEDNTDYTLMSYTHVGAAKTAYSPYDIAALMWLYGGDGLGGALGQGAPGNYLVGSDAADTLTGGSGNDTFEGKGGNDTIYGGAGDDTAIYSGQRSLYTITWLQGGNTISGPDGTDTLMGVEKAKFADQTVTLINGTGPNVPPTGSVLIAGTLQQGELLSAVSTLDDANGMGKLSYRWQSSHDGTTWADIDGAIGTTLTPGEALVGWRLRVTVSYTDGGGTLESATSLVSVPVANVNDPPTGAVFINGTVAEDSTLTLANTLADLDGLGTLGWQWQVSTDGSNWSNIAGANGTSYTPGDKQVGQRLRAIASWTDGHGTAESVPSAATPAVVNVNDLPTGTVTISGSAEQGQTLKAGNTLADADGLGAIGYEWQTSATGSSWAAIAGASGSSLTLAQAQVGQLVRALARYTDGHGTAESVPSAATAIVAGRLTGTPAADNLVGSAYADRIDGLDGNDRLQGGGGDDRLDGGAGIDTAVFSHPRSDYAVNIGGGSVKALAGDEGTDTLVGIERLQFSDQSLALDLDAAAGTTARILGAVFGREAVTNKAWAGIGLSLLDGGMDKNALMQMALDARLGSGFSATAEVTLLFQNLVGAAPSAADLVHWSGALQSGQYTPVSLAWMAANLDLNAHNIDLVGLAAQGLPYSG